MENVNKAEKYIADIIDNEDQNLSNDNKINTVFILKLLLI